MNFKNLYKNLMKTYTIKILSSLVFLDITVLLTLFVIYTYTNDDCGSGIIFVIFYAIITIVYSLIKFFIIFITLLLEKFYIKPDYEIIYIDKKIMIIETVAICLQIILFPIIFFLYLFMLIN